MVKNERAGDHFGFLSVVKLSNSAWVGGYLLLNALGRPVEFHCSEAVKPTRAQEILYGISLEGYVHAEVLGRTLLSAAKIQPAVVFVDSLSAMELGERIDQPVLYVCPEEESDSGELESRVTNGTVFQLGENSVALYRAASGKVDANTAQTKFCSDWQSTLESWLLGEPFQRIQEAILETQKAA